jgi:hypothetical protein
METQQDLVMSVISERLPGETNKAAQAFADYLQMGIGRTIDRLHTRYIKSTDGIPTKQFRTLLGWSSKFNWVERAGKYDLAITRQRENGLSHIRKEVLEDGLALDYERVRKLKSLANLLWDEINEEDDTGQKHKLWMKVSKVMGQGKYAQRIDYIQFNEQLLNQFRATLDDIAKEVGGRPKLVPDTAIQINDNRQTGVVVVPQKEQLEDFVMQLKQNQYEIEDGKSEPQSHNSNT